MDPDDRPGFAASARHFPLDRPTIVVHPGPADESLRENLIARDEAARVAAATNYLESLGYKVVPPDPGA